MGICYVCENATGKKCQGCEHVYYCSVVCQKSHWKEHKPACEILRKNLVKDDREELRKRNKEAPSYEIVPIPGKGMGIVAKRKIKEGELILKEQPVFRYASTTKKLTEGQHLINLFNYFLGLPKSKQNEISPLPSQNMEEKWLDFQNCLEK